jgi:hypothetical protein
VTQKRRPLRAKLVSVQNYVRVAAPEPEVLRAIGEESVQKATHKTQFETRRSNHQGCTQKENQALMIPLRMGDRYQRFRV